MRAGGLKSGSAAATPTAPRRWQVPQALKRAGAAVLLLVAVAVVAWGYGSQGHNDPFVERGRWETLVDPLPHPHYAALPFRPVGARRDFLPAGLEIDRTEVEAAITAVSGQPFTLNRMAADPGSDRLVAVGADGRVYQTTDGTTWEEVALPRPEPVAVAAATELAKLPHGDIVSAAAFTPDGGRILTASHDGTVRVWDAETGAELIVIQHDSPVKSVAVSPDGTRIAAGDDGGAVRLWTLDGRAVADAFTAHKGPVRSVAFSPDGTWVVSGGDDGTIRWLGTAEGRLTGPAIDGQQGAIRSIAVSPDGTVIASAGDDGTVRLWTWDQVAAGDPLDAHAGPVLGVAFARAGTHLVSVGEDRYLQLWVLNRTGYFTRTGMLAAHTGPVTSAAFSSDGALIASGRQDGTVRLSTLSGEQVAEPIRAHDTPVTSVAFSPDGTRIVTASEDGTSRVWDILDARALPLVTQSAVARSSVALALDAAVAAHGTIWVVGRGAYIARIDAYGGRIVDLGKDDELGLDLFAVHASGSGGVSIAGANGLIFTSPDGEAWDLQSTGTDRTIHAIQVLAGGEAWAAGDGGVILHRESAGSDWEILVEDLDVLRLTALHVQAGGPGWAGGENAGDPVFQSDDPADPGSWEPLPHYTAPWWFLIGLPALVVVAFVNVRVWRTDPPPPADSIVGHGLTDRPVGLGDHDALNLKPLALGLSRFLRNVNTVPPITIAVSGRWGSGKSSLMTMLQEDLRRHGGQAVWFNAWHHREEEHLLAALVENLRAQALPSWWTWSGFRFHLRLFWLRTRRTFINLFAVAALALLVLLLVRLFASRDEIEGAIATLQAWLTPETGEAAPADSDEPLSWIVPEFLRVGTLAGTLGTVGATLVAVGAVFLWLYRKLKALPSNPGKLLSRIASNARVGDFQEQLSFRHRFARELNDVCRALRTRTAPGLVVLIDDLDRCLPTEVLEVLEAINYLVTAAPCIVILGIDRRQVEHCVGIGFKDVVAGLPDDELLLDDIAGKLRAPAAAVGVEGTAPSANEDDSSYRRQRAYARHYLEKLINIEVPIPVLSRDQALAMLPGQAQERPRPEQPSWVGGIGTGLRWTVEIARFSVVGLVLALLLVALVSAVSGPVVNGGAGAGPGPTAERGPDLPTAPLEPAEDGVDGADDTADAQVGTAGPAQSQETTAGPLTVPTIDQVDLDSMPPERRWLWWGPTVLAAAVVLLWGAGVALRRRTLEVRDSPAFTSALRVVHPLVYAAHSTPRAIKRFQNRMRYLAVRLNPLPDEIDPIEKAIFNVGRWLRRDWIPEARIRPAVATNLSEPKLILLGAAEAFERPLLDRTPEELFEWLNAQAPSEGHDVRMRLWWAIRNEFLSDPACLEHWPNLDDVRYYRGVLARAIPLPRCRARSPRRKRERRVQAAAE